MADASRLCWWHATDWQALKTIRGFANLSQLPSYLNRSTRRSFNMTPSIRRAAKKQHKNQQEYFQMMAFTALCRWLIEWKDGVSQIIPLISLRASERRRGMSGNTGMQGPARAPAGAGGPLGYLGGAGGGMLGGGGGSQCSPPRQPVLHTQVLLSAGVFLQLLAKDWFNYFHSLRPRTL